MAARMNQSAGPAVVSVADDHTLLPSWLAAFEALTGRAVATTPIGVSDDTAGLRLTFPRVFQPIELVGGFGHFRHSAALIDQVTRLGFAWEDDGRVLTVPAAGTFNALLELHGLPDAGFRLAYSNGAEPSMPLGPWLRRYMDGVITVLVQTPSFYEMLLAPDLPPPFRDGARWGLLSVAHDLSVHALNYQLIPHVAIDDLAARIRTAVPDRYAAWVDPSAVTPLTLTFFYDNDLNRYTYAVWCRCQCPEDFARVFLEPGNYAQLTAALEVRLDETTAGRGDVASGDFDEVGPLTPTSFDVT